MALSGCYGVLKWIVFIVNLIFWLAGVGVLALSIWLLFDQAVVFMAKGAQDYATGTYILLAAGALMTVIGFLGCCGALRESQCLLGTFFVFLMIILVAEIAGGVWAYMNRAELNKLVQESVRDTVRRDYGKDDVTTKTFDMIQKTLKCCGAESYASWANSAYNGVGEKSQMEIGISALSPTYSVPKSCCADPDSDACETTRKLGSLGFAASALGIVYTDGCAPKLEALLQQYLTYVSATGIGIGIIEHEPNNEHLNRADLNKLVQERMRHAVRRDYGKDDVTTKTFDMIQRTLKCCGAESYASWANSAYNGVGEKSQMEIGISALSPTYSVPKSCCADPDTDLCETTRKLGSLGFAASALGIVYTDGCAPKLEALLQQYFTYVFATGTGIGFGIIEHEPNNEHMNRADLNKPGIGIIELLGMIFSMLLCCAIRKI